MQADRIADLEAGREFELVGSTGSQVGEHIIPAESQAPTGSGSPIERDPGADNQDWIFRVQVAKEIGVFLRNAVNGMIVGSSSRSKVNLRSQVYILVRDTLDVLTTNPVRVYKPWGKFKHLVEEKGYLGQAIFIGLAIPERSSRCCCGGRVFLASRY